MKISERFLKVAKCGLAARGPKRPRTGLLMLAVAVALAAGCSKDADGGDDACGFDGEEVGLDGEVYCVYRQSVVVENGFECPQNLPHLTEAGGIGVCSDHEDLPEGELERIGERYREERPDFDGCILDMECDTGEVCREGACVPPANNGGTNNGGTNNGGTNNGTTNNGSTNNGTTNASSCTTGADCGSGEVCDDGTCAIACGGFAGFTCSDTEWCDYPDGSFCGGADELGVCRPRPEGCGQVVDPVCGCDGNTHSNACMANAAGTDVSATGPCQF